MKNDAVKYHKCSLFEDHHKEEWEQLKSIESGFYKIKEIPWEIESLKEKVIGDKEETAQNPEVDLLVARVREKDCGEMSQVIHSKYTGCSNFYLSCKAFCKI